MNQEPDYRAKKQLAEHFAGKQFTDKGVAEYCALIKTPLVPKGFVEDYIYQIDFDKRMSVVIPLVLEKLSLFKHIPEFISNDKQKEMSAVSDEIEIAIARVFEENEVEYREVGVLKSLAQNIAHLLENSSNRINSEGSTVFMEMAKEKLGSPVTIKSIMLEKRSIEKRIST